MDKKEACFVEIVANDPDLGQNVADMVRALLRAQDEFKRLRLPQRLKLTSLATINDISRVRITTYE